MQTRTRRHRLAAAVAVASPFLWLAVGATSTGAASSITDVGWWTRNPLASAPDGGFAVGAAADGPSTVAAIRVDVGDGVTSLVLGAEPADGSAGFPSVQVCLGADSWPAATGDPLEEAPTSECGSDAVPFALAGDRWRADVSSIVAGLTGTVSLAIVPTEGSGTVPFEVGFEAPTVLSEVPARSSSGERAPTTTAPAPAPPAADPAPAPSGVSDPSPTPEFGDAPVAAAASPTTTLPVPSAPAADESETAAEVEEDDTAFQVPAGSLQDITEGRDARWLEAFVLVLVAMAVGGGVYGVSRAAESRA